jgi:hypothetical protein
MERARVRFDIIVQIDPGGEPNLRVSIWPYYSFAISLHFREAGSRQSWVNNQRLIRCSCFDGFGGSEKYEVTSLPQVILGLGGRPVVLRPAHILPTQQREQRKWFYGNLGEDLLGQTQYVSIDFRTMTLELGPPIRHRRRPSSSKR